MSDASDLPPHPSPDPADRPASDLTLGMLDGNPAGMSLRALWREDFATHDRDFFAQGFWAIAVHRFGNWRMGVRTRLLRMPLSLLYRSAARMVQWMGGIDLPYTTRVGRRVRIWHHSGMTLEALEIGDEVHIRQNTTFGLRRHGDPRWLKPVIGRGVQIGAGAVIVGPVRVGEGSVIGANVVLAHDVPPQSIVTAAPAVMRPLRSTPDA
jgi:serine O-acetyltransferase